MPAHASAQSQLELLTEYKVFLKKEDHRLRLEHRQKAVDKEGGREVCRKRSGTLDVVLHNLFNQSLTEQSDAKLALLAVGGYGRQLLNPGSDIDILFLHPGKVTTELKEVVDRVLYMLWDVGFKVGYQVMSIKETLEEANKEHKSKSSLLEARFLTGDRTLFDTFITKFKKECLDGKEADYLAARVQDLRSRHADQFQTFLVKEPNVKNGCGGLRDVHNLQWVCRVKLGTGDFSELERQGILSPIASQELQKALDFLLLVRNELHWHDRRGNDRLTLQAQGVVAKTLNYPGRRITERCAAFMRDYYHHTRHIFQHNESVMERFQLEKEAPSERRLIGFLTRRKSHPEELLDGFIVRDGFIYPQNEEIFHADPVRLITLFQHAQVRQLKLSPQIRQTYKNAWPLITKTFQYKKQHREIFEAILSRKGDVATALRQMDRVRFLGRYLPEYGALCDLVQHEFFHRYTADEHTLQTIEKLDLLSDSKNRRLAHLQDIFHELEDPFVLYLALIMHDTGRSTDSKHHEDGSQELTDRVCKRLGITGHRRQLLMFLVAHHLSMFMTATKKDVDDPEVIAEFGSLVRHSNWLDALYLMTYADSAATHEHGWTDWKEMQIRRLYHQTQEFLQDQEAFRSRTQSIAAEVRASVVEQLDHSYDQEVAAHWESMPERYFRSQSAASVINHLRQIRKYFRQLARPDPSAALTPVLKWVPHPHQGFSELLVISWDRNHLLSRMAGVLAAHSLNILNADFLTRQDGIVLDIFRVCTTSLQAVTEPSVQESVIAMTQKAFSGESFDFEKLIAAQSESDPTQPAEWQMDFPPLVRLSNEDNPDFTAVEIHAVDRIGLLHSIFRRVGDLGMSIAQARISTEKGAAIDYLLITGRKGGQVKTPERLKLLADELSQAVGLTVASSSSSSEQS